MHRCPTGALVEHSPCFLVAKFLGNNLRQLQTQTVSYFLRQVRVRTAAEYFDIGHFFWSRPGRRSVKRKVKNVHQQLTSSSPRAAVTTLPFHHYGPHMTRAALPRGAARARFSLTRCRSDVIPEEGGLREIAGPAAITTVIFTFTIDGMSSFVIAQCMFVPDVNMHSKSWFDRLSVVIM